MSFFKKSNGIMQGEMLFSNKALVKLIIPLFIQQVLSVMVGAVDTMMVKDAGKGAVGGVSLINTLDTLLVIFFTAMVTGGSVVIAQKLGEKNKDDISEAAKQLLYASTALALLLTVTVLLLRGPLLALLGGSAAEGSPEMLHARDYFFFISMSFPFLAISFSCGACFQAAGNSIIPLSVSLGSNVINIVGNALFIYGLRWGAGGAAIATLISRIVNSMIQLWLLHNKKREVYVERLFHYKPNFIMIKKMMQIGIPNGIENAMFQFGRLLTQTLILGLGAGIPDINGVALTIANFQYMTGTACSSAMVPVVGRCIGARQKEQAKMYSRKILSLNYFVLWAVVLLTVLFVEPLVGLYGLESGTPEAFTAMNLIVIHSLIASLIWPIGFMLPSAFRAASDVRFPMVVSMLSMWILRVIGAYFLALESISVFGLFEIPGFGWGIYGVWIAMFADWVVRVGLYIWRYFSDSWLRIKFKDT